jgi:uncharacterized protein (TIGR03067 family)
MADNLSGTWHGVYCEVDGETLPPSYAPTLEATYHGDRFSIKVQGKVEHEGTYSVDDKAEPHQITFTYTKSSKFPLGQSRVGIYQVTGDTYKNCLGPVGAKAPSRFNSTAKSNTVLTILRRDAGSGTTGTGPIAEKVVTRLLNW